MSSINGQSMYERYFIYSKTEYDRKMAASSSPKHNYVIVNGVRKEYTSKVTSMNNAPADAIVVIKGDQRTIKTSVSK